MGDEANDQARTGRNDTEIIHSLILGGAGHIKDSNSRCHEVSNSR